jgi:hypothetical protein
MREYKGTGTLQFSGIPITKGTFRLVFEDSGETNLFFTSTTTPIQLMALPRTSGKFIGNSLNPQCNIEINTIYLSKLTIDKRGYRIKAKIFHLVKIIYKQLKNERIEVRRGLSNLIVYGTISIQYGKSWIRGKTECLLGKRKVQLIQLPDFTKIIEHLKKFKDVRTTCELRLEGNYDEINSMRNICENVQYLCSLASGNFVTAMYEDIYLNEKIYETTLLPLKTYPFSNSIPLIDTSLHGRDEFKTFLETTYSDYLKFKSALGLDYAIEFFTSSKIYSPLEAKYLLATTAFECLENYFRRWKSLNEIRSLKTKMSRMFTFFGFNSTNTELESYRKNRNSIIHEGKFPSSTNSFTATMELRNLIERFLLFLLGYKNKPYYNVINQKKEILT